MGAKIKDLKFTEAGGSATEIVTISEVKDYLQIEGTGYDGPIGIFVTAARQMLEQLCSVSLIEKVAIAIIESTKAEAFKLPFYPVESITQIQWKKCPSTWVTLTGDDYCTYGENNVYIESSEIGLHKITYVLGVSDLSVWRQAIQAQAAFMFNNRDAKPGTVAPEVMALIQPFYTYS